MARKLFTLRGIRKRDGSLADGVAYVAYTDSGGTTPANVADSSGGSALAASTFTLGSLGDYDLWGPTDDTSNLFLRCPSDTSLGVQEVKADPDPRLDALEGGGSGIPATLFDAKGDVIAASAADTAARLGVGANDTVLTADSTTGTGLKWAVAAGTHPNLATHDSLGLATDAELTTHAGAADPHTGYVLESLVDAKGDLIGASADNAPAKVTVGNDDTVLVADSTQAAGVRWAYTTAFSPLSIAGSVLWYAADRIPGVAHAGAVASWPDLTGNTRHAVQATGGKQPTLQAGVQNGLPVVRFDGTDDTLATGAAAFPTSSTRTIIAVGRHASGNGRLWGMAGTASVFANNPTWGYYGNQADAVTDLGGAITSTTVVSVVYASTSSVSAYLNGGTATTFDPNNDFSTSQVFALANTVAAGTDYMTGDIAEVVMYDSALSTANRQRVERYLGAKWGIAVA